MVKKNQKKDDVEKLRQEVKQDMSDEVEKTEEGELISAKKTLYIEIDDEIGTIYDKLKKTPGKHIYIVVPKRAVLFQSVVNLKILKRKAQEADKILYFITNDKNGIHLAGQVGIQVYDKATQEGKPVLFSTEVNDEKLRITPLRATVNSFEDEAPTRLAERKLSISQILRKTKNKAALKISKIDPLKKKQESKTPKFVIVAPNRHALIGLVVLTVFVLLTIIYIALPGATVYLTPSASVLEKSVNITLADYQKNRAELETKPIHMIASYPVSATVSKTLTHYATGKKLSAKNVNASGKLTIINTTTDAWPLIARTRFQTKEGIVFRIAQEVTVPAASGQTPGKLEVNVTADSVDAYGAITGERGNIGPSKFSLPGLRDVNQSKIYAESSAPMTGGVTDYVAYITKEDLEAAKVRIGEELKKEAVNALKAEVTKKTELAEDKTVYAVLTGDNAIKISDVRYALADGLENKEAGDFSISAEISVDGVYYDLNEMTDVLKGELILKKSPQKELLRINEDSVSYRIFEWNAEQGKIKMTANIKGIEQYQIDPDSENGRRLLDKIREHIVGKDIDSAKDYIQNLPEINKVEIESWPAWSPTVPSIPDNIDFEIKDNVKPS